VPFNTKENDSSNQFRSFFILTSNYSADNTISHFTVVKYFKRGLNKTSR